MQEKALGAADTEHALAGLEAIELACVHGNRQPAPIVTVTSVALVRSPSKYSRPKRLAISRSRGAAPSRSAIGRLERG